jgi:hypothetical protein
MELVLFEVALSYLIRKVEKNFEWNEKKTVLSNQVVLFEYFVNHIMETNRIIHSFKGEAFETDFIKVLHHFFSLVMAMFVVQTICMNEEFRVSVLIFIFINI